MKVPIGILKTIAGIVASEVIDRVSGDSEPEREELIMEVVDKVTEHTSINPEEFTAELIMELLTEERSDEFLDIIMAKFELPFGAGRILKKALDSQLPEIIRDPLLEMVGYDVIDGNLVKKP